MEERNCLETSVIWLNDVLSLDVLAERTKTDGSQLKGLEVIELKAVVRSARTLSL